MKKQSSKSPLSSEDDKSALSGALRFHNTFHTFCCCYQKLNLLMQRCPWGTRPIIGSTKVKTEWEKEMRNTTKRNMNMK